MRCCQYQSSTNHFPVVPIIQHIQQYALNSKPQTLNPLCPMFGGNQVKNFIKKQPKEPLSMSSLPWGCKRLPRVDDGMQSRTASAKNNDCTLWCIICDGYCPHPVTVPDIVTVGTNMILLLVRALYMTALDWEKEQTYIGWGSHGLDRLAAPYVG